MLDVFIELFQHVVSIGCAIGKVVMASCVIGLNV